MSKSYRLTEVTDNDIRLAAQSIVYQNVTGRRAVAAARLLGLLVLPSNDKFSVSDVSTFISMELRRQLVRSLGDPAQFAEVEQEIEEEKLELMKGKDEPKRAEVSD